MGVPLGRERRSSKNGAAKISRFQDETWMDTPTNIHKTDIGGSIKRVEDVGLLRVTL